jgi:hypothetical protein
VDGKTGYYERLGRNSIAAFLLLYKSDNCGRRKRRKQDLKSRVFKGRKMGERD